MISSHLISSQPTFRGCRNVNNYLILITMTDGGWFVLVSIGSLFTPQPATFDFANLNLRQLDCWRKAYVRTRAVSSEDNVKLSYWLKKRFVQSDFIWAGQPRPAQYEELRIFWAHKNFNYKSIKYIRLRLNIVFPYTFLFHKKIECISDMIMLALWIRSWWPNGFTPVGTGWNSPSSMSVVYCPGTEAETQILFR